MLLTALCFGDTTLVVMWSRSGTIYAGLTKPEDRVGEGHSRATLRWRVCRAAIVIM